MAEWEELKATPEYMKHADHKGPGSTLRLPILVEDTLVHENLSRHRETNLCRTEAKRTLSAEDMDQAD